MRSDLVTFVATAAAVSVVSIPVVYSVVTASDKIPAQQHQTYNAHFSDVPLIAVNFQ